MASSLRINPTVESRIFQCPNCKETIDTSASQCPFCSASIDARAAEAAADLMKQVNQACSDASYLRIMAGTMLVFFGVSLVPLVGMIGSIGLWFLSFAVPVMAIRWWLKFGGVRSDDPGFRDAKRATRIAPGIWVLFIILFVVGSALGSAPR